MSFQAAVTVITSGLAFSIASGLLFVTLLQPRRRRRDGWFALFLVVVGLWAYFSTARIVPDLSLLDESGDFFLQFAGLTLAPAVLALFVFALVEPDDPVATGLQWWTVVLLVGTAALLWTDRALRYHPGGAGADLDFTLEWPGYVLLAHAVVYGLAAVAFLRFSDNPDIQPLQAPATLLVIGSASTLIAPLRGLPIPLFLATAAAALIGYTLLHGQVFAPLREANAQLQQANAELRSAFSDLAAEKEHTTRLGDELRAASASKSQFLANMSHELRTPLNSIVGYSELLTKGVYGGLSDKQQDRVEKIHRNGLNLLTLINDILDLSRLEGGRLELNLSTVRLAAMIDGLIATVEPLIGHKELALHTDIDTPLRLIHADELRIRQVLVNLLTNAIRFTPWGHVKLSMHNVTVRDGTSDDFKLPMTGWLEDRHWLIIAVEDTGIGIAPEDQAKIFDEFQQVKGAPDRQQEGAGLGLAIAKKLIELHTGRIWLNSQPQQGSTFYVALPALDEFDISLEETDRSLALEDMLALALVVTADDAAAQPLSDALSAHNYLAVRAHDVPSALARLHENRPAAILVDVLLPDLGAWELVRELRNDPDTAGIPVMLVHTLDEQPEGFPLGATVCIHKPVQRDELLPALARVQRAELEHPVLVIDDDDDERKMLYKFLESEGITASTCDSAQEALAWLEEAGNAPGLVLLNLVMPKITGFEVLHKLRRSPRWAEVPVVLLCPFALAEREQAALSEHITRVVRRARTPDDDVAAQLATLLAERKNEKP
jgi:signal transduction histidine kinase/DNA-binding response OmpR family regulator